MLEIFDLVIGPRNMLGGFHFDICRSAHIYLRVLVVGQPGVEVGDAEALPLAEGGRLLRADAQPEGEADAHAEGESGADKEGDVEGEAYSAVPEALSATETVCVRDAGAVLEAQALSEDHREAVAPSVALPV